MLLIEKFSLLHAWTCVISYYLLSKRKPKIPKGLKPLPEPPGKWFFIGHLLALGPERYRYRKITEWSKILGDIFLVYVGRHKFIFLNSEKVVNDLLQKRGAKYSSRLGGYITWEILARKRSYIFSPYNDWYKKMMPLAHGFIAQRKVDTYFSLIDECSRDLLNTLLCNGQISNGIFPKDIFMHGSFNVILNVLFAIKTSGVNDPLYKEISAMISRWFHAIQAANYYVSFPFLKILEKITNIHLKEALECRDEWETKIRWLLKKVKDDEKQTPCAARDFLKKMDEGVIDELDAIHMAQNFFIGGTETVATTLTVLMGLLASHTEIQKRAQKELDEVVGRSRLPDIGDEASLPFVRAIIKEVLRLTPPLRSGIAHFIEEDDEYNGFYIPKNTLVVINTCAIETNEDRHKNPHTFDPTRFLGVKERSAALAQGASGKRDHFAFGAGRRLCVGIHLAEVELQIFVSRILWAFQLEFKGSSENIDGLPPKIDITDYTGGNLAHELKPFNIRFIPRHETVETILGKN
ncbi:hypothetical protein G9A89_007873 [Geosiphon pyriformis]|nr:hypothetical protein G9A89_007873 [Geosiphon pyriformis]